MKFYTPRQEDDAGHTESLEDTLFAWRKHQLALWDRMPEAIRENLFSLHDAIIAGGGMEEGSFILRIEPSQLNRCCCVHIITFADCEVIHMDGPIERGWWLDVELDILEDGRYEVGIVFAVQRDGEDRHCTLKLRAASLTIERDEYTQVELRTQRETARRIEQLLREVDE